MGAAARIVRDPKRVQCDIDTGVLERRIGLYLTDAEDFLGA